MGNFIQRTVRGSFFNYVAHFSVFSSVCMTIALPLLSNDDTCFFYFDLL